MPAYALALWEKMAKAVLVATGVRVDDEKSNHLCWLHAGQWVGHACLLSGGKCIESLRTATKDETQENLKSTAQTIIIAKCIHKHIDY
jgi:hypothetical protein